MTTAGNYKRIKARKGPQKKRRKTAKKMQKLAQERRANNGCPETYDPDFARQATMLCDKGATDFDLAQFFGVTVTTIRNWCVRHQPFFAALHAGKEAYDDRVERALAERAMGYNFNTEKIFCTKEGDIIRAETVEHVPPDVKAATLWLSNRRGDKWKVNQANIIDPDKPLQIVITGGFNKDER